MINRQVFRTIQSGKEKKWYAAVTNAALYMATGGFLKEANELLVALWKYNLDHDRTTWMADNAFEMLWYAADERPKFVPFDKVNIDELELEFRRYCTPLEIKDNRMPLPEIELERLLFLEVAIADTSKMANYEFCNCTSLAAELAAKNNKIELAIKMAKLWASNYHERYLGYSFSKMANSRHVAPLLLQGIIADELKLTKEKCIAFVSDAIKVIEQRMREGDSLVYGKLSWTELLKKLSTLCIKDEPELFDKNQKEKNWIGYSPTTMQAIKQAEKRLGLKLPDDYKAFLLVSNGLPELSSTTPALLPIEEVDLLKNQYRKIYNDEEMLNSIKSYYDEEKETIAEYVERAICISKIPEEQEIWLIPPIRKTDDWQTWFFAFWLPGEDRFKSFRQFIENKIQRLDND
jgi:SMI1 / KNR4 family (SUKH-1)